MLGLAKRSLGAMARTSGSMTLNGRLTANLCLIGGLGAIAVFVAISIMIQSSFANLEQAEVNVSIARSQAYLEDQQDNLVLRVRDWGVWDESYTYIHDFNPAYETSNINAEAFRNAGALGIAYVRFDDSQSKSFYFDQNTGSARPDLAAALLIEAKRSDFRRQAENGSCFHSFLQFNNKLHALAGCPIMRSDLKGESEGYIVFLEQSVIAEFNKSLQVNGRFALDRSIEQPVVETADSQIAVKIPIKSITGAPVATVSFDLERKLMGVGETLRMATLLALLSLGAAMLIALRWRISTLIVKPISLLNKHVSSIRATGQIELAPMAASTVEIKELHDEFNSMFAEMEALRTKTEVQSFELGRHQTAIGVVHNVRNSLSPIKVILATIGDRITHALPPEVAMAISELRDPSVPQERRERLVEFLVAAREDISSTLDEVKQLAGDANQNLALALDVLAGPQQAKSTPSEDEICDLPVILRRAANAGRFNDDGPIEIVLDCPDHLHARGNRTLLSQILENLITNAAEAIKANGTAGGCVSIRARPTEDGSGCSIIIRDDGEGFDPALAHQLFQRGYSTRADKVGGLGLHWCANTINAMGGTIDLSSQGKGQGAVATIFLPSSHKQAESPVLAA